jgi:hypothetical protein
LNDRIRGGNSDGMALHRSMALGLCLAVHCGSSGAAPARSGGDDAGAPDVAASDASTGSDAPGARDGMTVGDAAGSGDGATGDDSSGGDGGVLAGPVFSAGFALCGQATVDDAALQAACNGTMGGTPNAPPSTPLECTALTGSVDVAVGCEETACEGYQCIQVEVWVRVTARSSGTWTYGPGSQILANLSGTNYASCWSQTQTPGGLVNDADQGMRCGDGWTGDGYFDTGADTTMAQTVDVPGGTYTASGQPISGTIWFPFFEPAAAPSTAVQMAFALAVPWTTTVP